MSTWCTVMHLLLCRWTLHYCHFMQGLLSVNFLAKTHCHSVNNFNPQCFVCESVSKEVRFSREWWGTSAGCELPVNTVIDWSSDSDTAPHSHHFSVHLFLSILCQSESLRSAAGEVVNQMCRRADRDTAPVKSLSPTLQNTYTIHYTVYIHNLVVPFSESYNTKLLLYKTVACYTFKWFL